MEPQDPAALPHVQTQTRIDELWDWDDPPASEGRFRVAAEAADGRERAILLTQAARALGLQARYAEALALLGELDAGDDVELHVRLALEHGRILNSSGHADGARAHFEAALDAARAAGMEHLAVDALHMIAIVSAPGEQVALNEQAIAMAETAHDPRARLWLASLYNNLGWTHFEAGEHAEALRLFQLALAERRLRDQPRETGIARWTVARALRALGRVEEALREQQALAAHNQAAGVEDPYVDEELGECLLALGRGDEARPHFARAAAGLAADPWLAEHEAARLDRLRELGGEVS